MHSFQKFIVVSISTTLPLWERCKLMSQTFISAIKKTKKQKAIENKEYCSIYNVDPILTVMRA